MNKFSERLKLLQKDDSGSAFAKRCGIPQPMMQRYLIGSNLPSAEMITRICISCGVSADWLLGLPTAGGGPTVTASGGAAVNIGSGSATAGGDCSKCRLMQDHIRQITGRG